MSPMALRSVYKIAFTGGKRTFAVPSVIAFQRTIVTSTACASMCASWVSDDLASRLRDKDLLKLQGFVGGNWVDANDNSTIDVRSTSVQQYEGSTALFCFGQNSRHASRLFRHCTALRHAFPDHSILTEFECIAASN